LPAYFQLLPLRVGKKVTPWSKNATKNAKRFEHLLKSLIKLPDYKKASLGIKVAVITDLTPTDAGEG